ncbi:hypothetical protein AB0I81_36975 [Nonomuraea sp. NPDC050404]|uniref:hypothetical protein n=1 Tax=Nonomuraea sp. NPDC050404 TaxID=3155783 RepID=UPI0033D353D2
MRAHLTTAYRTAAARTAARTTVRTAALVLAGVLLAGCASGGNSGTAAGASPSTSSGGPAAGSGSSATEVPHGYVEGAEEMSEPQYRLVLAGGGQAGILDLLTERTTAAAGAADVRAVTGDGRYAYLTTGTGELRVVDSGGWTVDHGDHVHYYKAATRDLGTVAGKPPYQVTGDAAVTAVWSGDGTVTLFDRARMDKGELAETGRLTGADAVVPYGERLLVATAGAVQVKARTGEAAGEAGACEEAEGTAVTRRGVVFGCADGALLVTGKDGEFEGVKIRYPDGTAAGERAKEFVQRPGSPTLAAKAGDTGIWVLDVTGRKWRLLKTGPVVAVCATGEDTPVLSLTEDGVLHAHDPRTGKETATTKLLTDPPTASPTQDDPQPGSGQKAVPSPVIQADTSRAYVNDPAGQAVHEIDYNDDLRRARTLKPGFTPAYLMETGR